MIESNSVKRLTKSSENIIQQFENIKPENRNKFCLECFARLAELEDKIENGALVELPCKMENIREITVSYKDYGAPLYAIVRYYCQQNKPYKILEYHIVGRDLLKNEDKRLWEWYPSMNFSRIEDSFTSREEAEARLKELREEE